MSALVEYKEGSFVTDSRTVADKFGKEHRTVVRSIENIMKQVPQERLHNFVQSFIEVETGNGVKRKFRVYDMDRDGFSLLAMGFTGKAALEWKIKFLEAFNLMESELAEKAANDDAIEPRLNGTPRQIESYKLALSTVRAAKEVFGEQVAQKMWPQLGLPDVPEIHRLNDRRSGQMPDGPLHEWTSSINMRHSPTRTTPTGFLYDCYAHWCDKNHYRPFTEFQFTRGLGYIFGEPSRFGFHVEHD